MKAPAPDTRQWDAVRRAFDAVSDMPAAMAKQHVEQHVDDADVRAEVLALLGARTESLERALRPLGSLMASLAASELNVGDRLGPWKLVERLASGGMGTVFVAERDDALYEQRVAIKFLRARAAPDDASGARLAAERRILAGLQHPNIARLYDGGTTPAGNPYLVMEYVQGRPLDAYVREQQPSLAQRIDLLLAICAPVQAAHEQLVIHCDLKPSNVMVRPDGTPVLLDFGIARLSDDEADAAAQHFTPAYASPEQIARGRVGITADIFSLGVLATELLGDARVPRTVSEADRPIPRASTLASDPRRARALRGDLDAILSKACAIDPAARYSSVEAFANDLRRYRARLPVRARAGGRMYVASRWLSRNRIGAAVSGLVIVTVCVFIWQVLEQRSVARAEARTAQATSDLLIDAFGADATGAADNDGEITARQILDRAAANLARDASLPAEARARMHLTLGSSYKSYGVSMQAEHHLRQAARAFLAPDVDKPLIAADALNELAVLMSNRMRTAEAIDIGREVVRLRVAHGAPEEALAEAYNALGLALQRHGQLAEARTVLEQALALRVATSGANSMQASGVLHNLAFLERSMGRYERAEALFRRALGIRAALKPNGDAEQSSLQGLAVVLANRGRLEQSIALHHRNVAMARRLFGVTSEKYALANLRRAMVQHDRGELAAAAASLDTAEAIYRDVTGPFSREYAQVQALRARLNVSRCRASQALAPAWQVVDILRRQERRDERALLEAYDGLAAVLLANGHVDDGRRLSDSSWSQWVLNHEADRRLEPELIEARLRRMEALMAMGRHDAARTLQMPPIPALPRLELRRLALAASLADDAASAASLQAMAASMRARQIGRGATAPPGCA